MNHILKVPLPQNESIKSYAPGTADAKYLAETLQHYKSQDLEIPMYVGAEKITTGRKIEINPPHDHRHVLGHFYEGDARVVHKAIEAAQQAKAAWAGLPYTERAAIFLRAAELLAAPYYRARINATTMLAQSKNVFQAEVDAACEYIDFLRYNVAFMEDLYRMQPQSTTLNWNQLEYRPLEGFVFAVTPFNFTSIAANLACVPALLGNTVIWKPAYPQIYSAHLIMEVLEKAGLPPGVINLIYVDGPVAGDVIFKHPDFAGLNFTGSTKVFKELWQTIGNNLSTYRSYPRIVGETGGKDFILAHPSADVAALSTAIIRGAFEYQGQKCSAASRMYIPRSLWSDLKQRLLDTVAKITVGTVEDFNHFMNAVISQAAFDRIKGYIEEAKANPEVEVLYGGTYDDSKGYFVQPTLLVCQRPDHPALCEEIFGPVASIYIYEDNQFEETTELINNNSPYGLTGAIFSVDRLAIHRAKQLLHYAAGNLYINDKPTGAVVSQQPFGGSRASGTNDKAGAVFNLIRWVSPRTIKENFLSPTDYTYPHMKV